MGFLHVPFTSMPWLPSDGGRLEVEKTLERKKTCADPGVCLLGLAVGFSDPVWCERAHVLYVVEGAFGLELEDREAVLGPGECGVLDRGTRHRAKNAGNAPVVVFVVSDRWPPGHEIRTKTTTE
jgi:hypothetical protein